MKRLFFLFPVFFSLALTAQVPTNIVLVESVDAEPEVVIEDVCWSVGAVDSSLTRFTYLDPSDSTNTQVLFYVNASGERVTVTGGSLSLGFCGCCEGSSIVSNAVGTFVKKLSLGENYTLPLDTLMKYDHLVFLAASNASSGDTAVINFPNLLNDGTETGLGKRLFVYAYQDLADSSYNVVVTAPGGNDGTGGTNSALRKYNCLPEQLTYSNDTILAVAETVHRLYAYTTVPGKAYHFYYRDCQEAAGSIAFDSDRPILRVPAPGDKIAGSTVTDFLEWWYFSPPTISLNVSGGTLFEVGTSNVLTLSGSTSNPGGSTLSAGVLQRTSPTPVNDVNTFNASTSYSEGVTFAPTQGGTADYTQLSYTFQASQDWEGGGQSGTATSPSRTVQALYPVLYGVSSTDLHSSGTAYQVLTKLVQTESNKQVTLNGTGFLWFAVPTTWVDSNLSSILDQNGFNVTASFSALLINIGSSGLTNNWTQEYRVYKSNNQATVTNATYTFNR